jgi:uncharacterized membrane protein SirB2
MSINFLADRNFSIVNYTHAMCVCVCVKTFSIRYEVH